MFLIHFSVLPPFGSSMSNVPQKNTSCNYLKRDETCMRLRVSGSSAKFGLIWVNDVLNMFSQENLRL
jgi:hypothetical protein